MKNLKTFEGYTKKYSVENFTHSDLQFAKELYEEGMTNPADIAREMDWKDMDEATAQQMIDALKSSGQI